MHRRKAKHSAAAARVPRLRPPLRTRTPRLHAGAVGGCWRSAAGFIGLFLGFCLLSCLLYPVLGRDFFPSVDAGQIRLHMRAPTGTRIEETARLADAGGGRHPRAGRRRTSSKPSSTTWACPTAASTCRTATPAPSAPSTARSCCRCAKATGRPSSSCRSCAAELPKRFPGIEFFFQPADIVTQILNFGLPAAIDVQFSGNDIAGNAAARGRAGEGDPQDSGRGRRPRAPAARRPGAQPADGPHAAAAVRPDRAPTSARTC